MPSHTQRTLAADTSQSQDAFDHIPGELQGNERPQLGVEGLMARGVQEDFLEEVQT